MDREGIDRMVLFPSRGLYACAVDDLDGGLANAITLAYNRWLSDFCSADPRRLGRPRLALDEAAGDLPGRVHPLLEIDGEREEVESRSGLRAVGGAQDERVAITDRDRTASEASDLAGLDGQRATTELRLECLRHGVKDLLPRVKE